MKRTKGKKLSSQVRRKVQNEAARKPQRQDGNTERMISTGSTLLDLAISGGRVYGGGLPGGILVEVFGPSGSGKTVLLCEIAGALQRQDGEIMFKDPEARLNKQFAKMFDLDVDSIEYETPDTVPQVFKSVRSWSPASKAINGVFADSLTALSTEMEMEGEDKYGMRRAKEFSEELRKTCRVLQRENYLMIVSNQIRQNIDAGPYGQKYKSPGGKALEFYCSLRLRFSNPQKINKKIKVAGKEVKRVMGVETEVVVEKSSVWKPFRTAPLIILFDYGIDNVQANLQFIKDYTKNTVYTLGGENLSNSMAEAIAIVEDEGWEKKLEAEVIELWNKIESKFEDNRKAKKR